MNNKVKLPIIIGVIDGILIFTTPFVLYLLFEKPTLIQYNKFLIHFWPYFIFVLFPISIIAYWRSKCDVERIIAGKNIFIKPIIEGVLIGLMFWFYFHFFGVLNSVLAAGTIYDSYYYKPAQLKYWTELIVIIFPSLFIFISFGGFIGFMMNMLNRILLKLLYRHKNHSCIE